MSGDNPIEVQTPFLLEIVLSNANSSNLFSAGRKFVLGGADFDAADLYHFEVKATEPQLVLAFRMEGMQDVQQVVIPTDAIDKAEGVLKLSQGSFTGLKWLAAQRKRDYVSPEAADAGFVPSFMLSRAQLAHLRANGSVELQPLWDFPDVDSFSIAETGVRVVQVDDKPVEVKVLTLQGAESTTRLTVVDNDRWPLILEREECDGGNVEKLSFETVGADN